MIRLATMADRTRAVELLAASHAGAGFDSPDGVSGFVFPFVPEYAEHLFVTHLANGNCYALAHDVGGVAQGLLLAVAYEHPFGPVWMARETVWWIDPAHRGRVAIQMLDAFEDWARGKECRFVGMAGMGEDPDIGKLYQRRGYRAAERHFLKAV
jgi:hypothetical protein